MTISFKKKKVWIGLALAAAFFLFIIFFQKQSKNFFYSISSTIQKPLWSAGDSLSDFFESIEKGKVLQKENTELRLKIQGLLTEIGSLSELKEENRFLSETFDLGLQKEFKLEIAKVIGKDISQDVLLIDKGEKDGIRPGFPAITPQKVLLGRVSEVFADFSKIQLISDKNSSFDAKIQLKENILADVLLDVPALVKGAGNFNVSLDFVPRDKNAKAGDIVLTSALGGIFPAGLLVGEIKEIKKSDVEAFQQALISPAFNISQFEELFLIIDY